MLPPPRSNPKTALKMNENSLAREIGWRCGDRLLSCGLSPVIMGILNVTPDSFSDGNRYFDVDKAVARGLEIVDEGAQIIDIGGESTRPGAAPVDAAAEIDRVVPVIERLRAGIAERSVAGNGAGDVLLSIDTTKAEVARRAVEAGASIVNDVSAMTHDPDMVEVAAACDAGVVLMHMRGNPRVMQDCPEYDDVATEVSDYLMARIDELAAKGIDVERIAVDPGIGFGKTVQHNIELLSRLEVLGACSRPIVVGLSRKSFLGKLTGAEVGERLSPSIAALSFCIARGAHVMRVHDVKDSVAAAKVIVSLCLESENGISG